MNATSISKLLRHVSLRQRLASLGARFYLFQIILAGVYLAVLLLGKTFSLFPEVLTWHTLLAVPALAALLALIFHRRPGPADSARLVDSRMDTKDLFLTSVLIEQAPGDYKPLVLREATQKASAIEPAKVVPFHWGPKASRVMLTLLVLAAAWLLAPQFDPFGQKEARERLAQRENKLKAVTAATMARKEALQANDLQAPNSKQVQAVAEDLKKTFQKMDPQNRQTNIQKLRDQQQSVGQLWRQKREQTKFRNALERDGVEQRFGGLRSPKAEQWQRDLQQGKTDSLGRELNEMKDLAQKMADTSDKEKKAELHKQLQERMQQMADSLSEQTDSQAVREAMARAMEQLDLAGVEGLSGEALQSLQDSLGLTEMELEQLAQNIRDLQSLEEALQAIQSASAANQQQPLDGAMCDPSQSLKDYAEMYEAMCQGGGSGEGEGNGSSLDDSPGDALSQGECPICQGQGQGQCQGGMCQGQGQGQGGGMGGPGQGRGNVAQEDDSGGRDFENQKAPSTLTAGKTLLEWKTKEVSQSGEAVKDYAQALREVKKGASEAIVKEEVPPGRQEVIKKYFDTLKPTPDEPADQPE